MITPDHAYPVFLEVVYFFYPFLRIFTNFLEIFTEIFTGRRVLRRQDERGI